MRDNCRVSENQAATRARKMLDHYRAAIRDGQDPFPYAGMIGMEVVDAAPGRAVVEMEAASGHHNPIGTVHGGALCSIADTAMGIAHATMLEEGEISTTVDLNINFLRPAFIGKLRAEGRVVKYGRTLSLVECDVTDAKGGLLARSTCTCMAIRADG